MKLSVSQVERYVPPLSSALTSELTALWREVFQSDYAPIDKVLEGTERQVNSDIFYVARKDGRIVGSSHVTTARSDPRIGGLGQRGWIALG